MDIVFMKKSKKKNIDHQIVFIVNLRFIFFVITRKQRLVTVPVQYLEKETYYGRCRGYYFKKCLNERTVPKTRNEQRIEDYMEKVRRCCDGWAERSGIGCLPICERSCIFGNCTEPNTCTCYEGYERMAGRSNV